MQFDSVQDVVFHFARLDDEEMHKILKLVARHYRGFQSWNQYEREWDEEAQYHRDRETYHLAIKRITGSDLEYYIQQLKQDEDLRFEQVTTNATYCWKEGCWNQVALETTRNDTLASFPGLFDRYGENLYEFHHLCHSHCSHIARHILDTIETLNCTPQEETYWTKVISWELRGKYYSQQMSTDQGGDYEGGYYDYTWSSPWLGPYETRPLAIEAARNYEGE